MLNTKLGYFYVHRYHFRDVTQMVALYEICRYLLYAIKAFGCLSHIIFAHRIMLQTNPVMQPASTSAITIWLNSENSLFSSVLENSVSNRQVLFLGHASLAFSALVCMSCVSVLPALFCLTWFAWSLYLCKKGGLR